MMNLLLLPGMDGTGTLFEPFLKGLGGRVRVSVVEYPATTPLGYSDLVTLARSKLPREGPVVVLGESFSGPIAISLAALHPEQVRGVVLCCSFAQNPYPFLSPLSPLAGIFRVRLVPTFALEYFLLGQYKSASLRAALRRALTRTPSGVFSERIRAVLNIDVSKALSGLSAPVLYLQASEDRLVPNSATDAVCRCNPGTSVVRVKGPHMLLQASPFESANAVHAFIERF